MFMFLFLFHLLQKNGRQMKSGEHTVERKQWGEEKKDVGFLSL